MSQNASFHRDVQLATSPGSVLSSLAYWAPYWYLEIMIPRRLELLTKSKASSTSSCSPLPSSDSAGGAAGGAALFLRLQRFAGGAAGGEGDKEEGTQEGRDGREEN